ncbi:MAG: Threonine--tRNA ligase [candidate division WS6 bacterium OLB20]|uniref:Threonine--tRNA ligase n=1 Tax=candidate division WS6 bacterium OLB20 TaxID=1617426 RepID=A0A136LXY1_9BACT|nr:MAG: Threonine--tRNA ligase [candidate division WS6 bacterium OLB20]
MNEQQLQALETMRHSFAHVLAQAVLRLYPGSKLGIGPVIEEGFYYDIEAPSRISADDLPQIEAEMKRIIDEGLVFKQIIIPREQAFDTLHHLGQIYKTELLQQIPDETISFYKTGEEFIDLCRGPHVHDTSQLRVFKLTSIETSYWLGDENRPEMQRIIGVAFSHAAELEKYLKDQEDRKLRDHRILGRQLGIFHLDQTQGKGMPMLLHNGVMLKQSLASMLKNRMIDQDYEFIESPEFIKESTLHAVRYLDYNRDVFMPQFQLENNMHRLRTDAVSQLFSAFSYKKRSYKELPLRLSEFAASYANIPVKDLHGLFKTRRFTRDNSVSFTAADQAIPEVKRIIKEMTSLLQQFELNDYRIALGTPVQGANGQHYIGNEQDWRDASYILEKALSEMHITSRKTEGEAAFYGPTLQFRVRDVFRREWTIASVGIDLALPKIANLTFVTAEGNDDTPVAIHHSFIGSFERFLGILTEEYGGAFPTWLAPEQVRIIPISAKHTSHAKEVAEQLRHSGIRVFLDARDETMQLKIRDAQIDRIPYMLIIGDKEIQTGSVSVRPRSGQDLGLMRTDEFAALIFKDRPGA